MPMALIALAISAFAIGTTEFVIMGLLPEVAEDFSVSIPTAGLLISGYALGVTLGGPALTAATVRFQHKQLLLGLLVVFLAGNLLSALASTYGLLMAGRIVAALCHGAFFGVGSTLAAALVPREQQARAVALMFTGVTLANVLGAPMGTFLGQTLGWRAAFWGVVALGAVSMVGIAALVPALPKPEEAGLRRELAMFRSVQVWLTLAMTAVGYAGVFASFTYIAPMMTDVAGFPAAAVSWLLVLFGVGLVVGNNLGGRAADRAPNATILVLFAALAAVLIVFVFTAHHPIAAAATLFLLGAVGFATVPPLQTRIMRYAEGAPTLASAANIAAFNLGNAMGAYFGGRAIDAELGLTSPNWVGALFALGGLAIASTAVLLHRRGSAGRSSAQPTRARVGG